MTLKDQESELSDNIPVIINATKASKMMEIRARTNGGNGRGGPTFMSSEALPENENISCQRRTDLQGLQSEASLAYISTIYEAVSAVQ